MNLRKHGNSPYRVVVVHGGPGAPGEMRQVAEVLSNNFGVLEPMQTKDSIAGQVEELKEIIEKERSAPVYLVGWSWGAWLSLVFTAKYHLLVKKLILISSGPFESKYAKAIMTTRLNRLSATEREMANGFLRSGEILKYAKIISKSDNYQPIDNYDENVEFQPKIYESVWGEAEELRKNGKLLKYLTEIKCPVVAIHGDYDPHPFLGVKEPLSKTLKDSKFYLLKNCGHKPWVEKEAKLKFYKILENELI